MPLNLGSSAVSLYLGDQSVTGYLGSQIVTATVPGAPTGLTGVGNSSLYWTAPEDDGGSEIIGYKVYADGIDVSDDGQFVTPSEIGGDVAWSSTGVFGEYEWTVSAINAVGEGPQSSPLTYSIV